MHFEVELLACRVARCVMCQVTQRACTKASYIACFSWWVNVFSLVVITEKGSLLTSPCCASLGYHSGSQKIFGPLPVGYFKKKKKIRESPVSQGWVFSFLIWLSYNGERSIFFFFSSVYNSAWFLKHEFVLFHSCFGFVQIKCLRPCPLFLMY